MKTLSFVFFQKHALLILLAGILGASLQLSIQYGFSERLWVDEAEYAWYAQRIAENPAIVFSKEIINTHPPLFSVILALGNIWGGSLTGCRVITLLISLSGIGMIYVLGKKLFNNTVGVLSAVLLATNSVYVKFSSKILIDGLLMTSIMLLAIALIHARHSGDPYAGFKVAVAGCATILLKWSALLVIPFIIAFYALGFDTLDMKQRIRTLLFPLGTILAVVLGLLINNFIQLGVVFGNVSALSINTSQHSSAWYYWADLPSLLEFPFALLFCTAGIFFSWKESRTACLLLVLWVIVFVVGFSLAAEKITRYSLAYLPSLLILVSLGMYRSAQMFLPSIRGKRLAALVVILYVCSYAAFSYPELTSMLKEENRFYTGFREVGYKIKRITSANTLIVASSPDVVRYYTGIEFKKYGGKIVYWPFRDEDRDALLKNHRGPMILVLDNWGRPGKLLVDPFSPALLRYLQDKGFQKFMATGQMRYYSSKGQAQVFPAIWIMKR